MSERKWPKNLASSQGTTGKPTERDIPCIILGIQKGIFWKSESALFRSHSRCAPYVSAHYYYYFYLYFTFVVGTLNISCLSSSLRFEPANGSEGVGRWAGLRLVAAVHVMVMVTYSSPSQRTSSSPPTTSTHFTFFSFSLPASASLNVYLIIWTS